MTYLDFVKFQSVSAAMNPCPLVMNDPAYQALMPLFDKTFCLPETSAPVDPVRPRRRQDYV